MGIIYEPWHSIEIFTYIIQYSVFGTTVHLTSYRQGYVNFTRITILKVLLYFELSLL